MSDERPLTEREMLEANIIGGREAGLRAWQASAVFHKLNHAESQNQALQERIEELAKAHACCWHGWDSAASRSLHDSEGDCKPTRRDPGD